MIRTIWLVPLMCCGSRTFKYEPLFLEAFMKMSPPPTHYDHLVLTWWTFYALTLIVAGISLKWPDKRCLGDRCKGGNRTGRGRHVGGQ